MRFFSSALSNLSNLSNLLISVISASTCLTLFLAAPEAQAWGKRGHSLVCQTAAYVASEDPSAQEPKASSDKMASPTQFLKSSSFDLGYYCNVPDLVWKGPDSYKQEWFNHFMDMERFDRAFRSSAVKEPFALKREEFNKAFPQVKDSDGRAFWRIQEFEAQIGKLTDELRKSTLTPEQRQDLQAKWMVLVGTMGHYVGDLGQPLHVTENYDGALNAQKGIHRYYEDVLIDQLYNERGRNLEAIVEDEARRAWPSFHKKSKGKTTLQLLVDLADSSNKLLPTVLKVDKKVGRSNDVKAGEAHRSTLVDSLKRGALTQAELISRHLGWEFSYSGHGDKFIPTPEMVPVPGWVPPATSPTPAVATANVGSNASSNTTSSLTSATTPAASSSSAPAQPSVQ